MKSRFLSTIFALLGFSTIANAEVITQTFDSSWTRTVWDYYGNVSALQWHYLPYVPWDSSLGTLTKVKIDTIISGTRVNPEDAVHIRDSFFTGWDPDRFQYYSDFYIPAGEASFSTDISTVFTEPNALSAVTNYEYFTGIYNQGIGTGGAWYYFESGTKTAAHTIAAETTLSYVYEPVTNVPEPRSWALVFIGMAGLSAAVRLRQRTA